MAIELKEIEELAAWLTPEQVMVLPFYHDLENEIRQPEKVRIQSEYFWERWVPKLGPTLTCLIITLRSYCYYNKLTKEKRDWCFPEQATLAKQIGVKDRKTVMAALRHPLAHHFIRREKRYRYDPVKRKKVRATDIYHVAMDEPILPEDEPKLVVLAAERILQEGAQKAHETQEVPPKSKKRTQIAEEGPKSKKRTQVTSPKSKKRTGTSTFINTNVNVDRSQTVENLERLSPQQLALRELIAEEIAEALEDWKSLGFYRLVAERCPQDLIYRALSETKEEARMWNIRTTKGAFFTDTIKRYAREWGISLSRAVSEKPSG